MVRKRDTSGHKKFNFEEIEFYYKKLSSHLKDYLPEGLIEIDIDWLHRFNLLDYQNKTKEESLTRYFHVLEAQNKMTLINEQFIIWIVPETKDEISKTFVLIALNQNNHPKIELGFVTSDIYNSSKLVLRILEKFLHEIQENEESLKSLKEPPP